MDVVILNSIWRVLLLICCLLLALVAVRCGRRADGGVPPNDRHLIVFHAGSLSVPLRRLSRKFEKNHAGVEVRAEAAGSRDCARKISDLGRRCDVLASADYRVVENLLRPKYASFNIRFASNEMTIAFRSSSRGAQAIDAGNWYRILGRDDVAFGYSDPDSDPCGYRAVMVLQLAERQYQQQGLSDALIAKDGGRYVRPKSTDLLALLEADELDYAFAYRSVAGQHRLRTLDLPDAINLSDPACADNYESAEVDVTGRTPNSTITIRGAPIVYSVTIPRTVMVPSLAEEYVSLLLSEQGRQIMRKCGQNVISPARVENLRAVPEGLRPLCQEAPVNG